MQRRGGARFYILPGGGQQHGETLEMALRRECREELESEIVIDRLLYIREYIGKNHTFANHHKHFHQLEVVFRCHLPEGEVASAGSSGDKHQIGVEWMPLAKLADVEFYPRVLADYIVGDELVIPNPYLGDIN